MKTDKWINGIEYRAPKQIRYMRINIEIAL